MSAELRATRDARLGRQEALKIFATYRDPLMQAAYGLQSRVYNILKQQFLQVYYTNGSTREQQ